MIWEALFELLGLAAMKQDDRRDQAEASGVLAQVAASFEGSVTKPWFRKPRALGHVGGREIEVIYLGRGAVEVRCRAQAGLELRCARAGFLSRLFGADTPRITGSVTRAREDAVRNLFHRFQGRSLRVSGGQLVARASPGADSRAIVTLARELSELAWRDPTLDVRVREASSQVSVQAAPGSAVGDLRCPFCHDDLRDDDLVVNCSACDAPHHPACFDEGDGCSISGCGQRKARGGRVRS